jgi:hypothetical protein
MQLNPVSRPVCALPVDDEPLTAEEEQALARADAWLEHRGGRGIPHADVLAEFGLTMQDFPFEENGA